MKCLSLCQPHAEAIALGLKPYETRGWSTEYRGPLAIHAAKHPLREKDCDWDWWCEMRKRLALAGMRLDKLSYGRIVCIVDLVDCVPTEYCRRKSDDERIKVGELLKLPDWFFWGDFSEYGEDGRRRFAFKLENVRKIPEVHRPLVRGMQQMFETTKEVHDELALWG